MIFVSHNQIRQWWVEGMLAGLVSTVVLMWRGRAEARTAAGPLNAPSHWLWGREALRKDHVDWRHTAAGFAIHQASTLFWAAAYRFLRIRHGDRPAGVLSDALVVTAAAALVELKLVPERLTPGFERRLTRPGLALVYLSFSAGLAVAGRMRVGRGPGACTNSSRELWRHR